MDTAETDSDTSCGIVPKKMKRSPSDKQLGKTVKTPFVTGQIAAALDRTKVTDREATHILAATAQSLGHKVLGLPLSRSSIYRARRLHRKEVARTVKNEFSPDHALVVHWDGKLLPDISGREKVDRLPVIVSGTRKEQLLGVPKISSGTGKCQASAVI